MKAYIIGALLASTATAGFAQNIPSPTMPEPGKTSGPSESNNSVGEIVVTAQKRSETANKVPMSITAASGDTLMKLGITQASDLAKVATGFNFTQTAFATPVYSIRGVGFFETSLAATPAVTVYNDEVPLPYPQMTRNAGLDISRVEILKGPQGTLFGQNSTGGAVNYIAAKPTDTFHAGIDGSFGRFNTLDTTAYVSGPISNTLTARVAGHVVMGSDWQESYTRDDSRGQKDILQGRLLLDWKPSSRWTSELNVNGWVDKSDTQATQLVARTPSVPALADPRFLTYPLAPNNDRAADWNPGFPTARNDSFLQASLRNDVDVTDDIKLTTITAYSQLKLDAPTDVDGTALSLYQDHETGKIRSFYQEARFSGEVAHGIKWIVGGTFGHDHVNQADMNNNPNAVVTGLFGPDYFVSRYNYNSDDKTRSYGAFGNIQVPLTNTLTFQGGVRYTNTRTRFAGCSNSPADDVPNGNAAAFQNLLNTQRAALGLPPITIPPAGCTTVDPATLTAVLVHRTLPEHNVAWRAGLNWQVDPNKLLYFNVSKGYKAGTFANIGSTVVTQYNPAKQEGLLAYEAGAKFSLADHHIQLNGAFFYYDYTDKQLRGATLDPIFGALDQLVNVPKSHVIGGEAEVTIIPFRGLRLSGGATFAYSRVDKHFFNFNPYGTPVDFYGESFPYTPKWQANGDVEYDFALSSRLNAFVGATGTYQGATPTAFGGLPIFNIPNYALLDLRAGISSPGDKWRLSIWGRNVTNKFYYTSLSYAPTDATVRSAGMPVTYGVSWSLHF